MSEKLQATVASVLEGEEEGKGETRAGLERYKEARGGRAEAGSKEFERAIRMVHTSDGSAKPGFHSIQQ